MNGYILTCPFCYYRDTDDEFDVSLVGECFCPKCDGEFILEEDEEDGDE